MEEQKRKGEERIESFVSSLELVTSRLLEMTIANSQLASSETREMRGLFDAWIKYMSDEVSGFVLQGHETSIEEIAASIGLSRESVLTLLVALDRRGRIKITGLTATPGDGVNSEICECLL
jgi:hypothetical protein